MNIKKYDLDERICVYNVYRTYIERTGSFKKGHSKLLLSFRRPYGLVTKDTISRWIKEIMFRSGIDVETFKAHSVRSASVTKAKKANIPMSIILGKAGWSSAHTFATYYDKQIKEADEGTVFAQGVLQDL